MKWNGISLQMNYSNSKYKRISADISKQYICVKHGLLTANPL